MNISRYIILIVCLAFAKSVSAQVNAGVKAGGGYSKFNSTKAFYGYTGGGFVSYPVFNLFTVRGEVLYTVSSGRLEDYVLDLSEEAAAVKMIRYAKQRINTHSVDLPLMIQAGFSENAIKLYGGVSYGFNLAAFRVADKTYVTEEETETEPEVSMTIDNAQENVSSSMTPGNVSIIAGCEFKIGVPFQIDIRYQQGFQPQNRLRSFETQNGFGELKGRTIVLSIGYIIL